MSDVPELDRLLEEHEIFRRNVQWDRRERILTAMARVVVSLASTLFACGFLGVSGVGVLPFVWSACAMAFPNPPHRDPFRRYSYK